MTFDPAPGLTGVDQPFHLQLTDSALHNPIFQIADDDKNVAAWESLPAFTQYGRVDRAKPGAVVWAEHQNDVGPAGKRILMAAQNYGAGRTAVITVQNFWRWRLAKDSDPDQFDRFWRQFFRWLGESGKETVLIDFANQDLEPPTDLHVLLERQVAAQDVISPAAAATASSPLYTVIVRGPGDKEIFRNALNLPPDQSVPFNVRAEKEGLYSIVIQDAQNKEVAERSLQLSNDRLELEHTGRDMENLQQWAALTGGKAMRSEDDRDLATLIADIKREVLESKKSTTLRAAWGLTPLPFVLLLAALSGEWTLRKRWNLL